jgi:hypothetical protein
MSRLLVVLVLLIGSAAPGLLRSVSNVGSVWSPAEGTAGAEVGGEDQVDSETDVTLGWDPNG